MGAHEEFDDDILEFGRQLKEAVGEARRIKSAKSLSMKAEIDELSSGRKRNIKSTSCGRYLTSACQSGDKADFIDFVTVACCWRHDIDLLNNC